MVRLFEDIMHAFEATVSEHEIAVKDRIGELTKEFRNRLVRALADALRREEEGNDVDNTTVEDVAVHMGLMGVPEGVISPAVSSAIPFIRDGWSNR